MKRRITTPALGGNVSTATESTSDSEEVPQLAAGFLIGLVVGVMVVVRSFMGLYPMPAGLSLWFLTVPLVVVPFLSPTLSSSLSALVGIGALVGLLVSFFTSGDWLPFLLLFGASLLAFGIAAVRTPETAPQPTPWQRPPEPKLTTVTEPVRAPTTPPSGAGPTTSNQLPPTFKKQPNKLTTTSGFGSGQAPAAAPDLVRPNAQPPSSGDSSRNSPAAGDAGAPSRSKNLGGPVGHGSAPEPSNRTSAPTSAKFCSECGESLTTSAKFCPGCGYNLT